MPIGIDNFTITANDTTTYARPSSARIDLGYCSHERVRERERESSKERESSSESHLIWLYCVPLQPQKKLPTMTVSSFSLSSRKRTTRQQQQQQQQQNVVNLLITLGYLEWKNCVIVLGQGGFRLGTSIHYYYYYYYQSNFDDCRCSKGTSATTLTTTTTSTMTSAIFKRVLRRISFVFFLHCWRVDVPYSTYYFRQDPLAKELVQP
jgi:hypothetical protein